MVVRAIVVPLALVALVASVPATQAQTRPSLSVVDLAPLTIRGKAFMAGETVTVRVARSGRPATRRAVASEAGAFRVRLAFAVGRCERFTARAQGSSGTVAVLPVRLRLDCVSDGA